MFLKVQYDTTNEWILYHIWQAINRRVARQARIGPFHQGICSCQQILNFRPTYYM